MRQEWRKGPWTPEEDELLKEHVKLHGDGRWSSVARLSGELSFVRTISTCFFYRLDPIDGVGFNGVRLGLKRNSKSCRLRWVNYLRPGLKRAPFTPLEEGIIIELHAIWGNKWSMIARYLPGRTDNEIKNYWRTHFKKKENKPYRNRKHEEKLKDPSSDVFFEQNKQDQRVSCEEAKDEKMNDEQGHDSSNVEDQCFLPLVPSCPEIPDWTDVVLGDDLLLWADGLWNFDDDLVVLS